MFKLELYGQDGQLTYKRKKTYFGASADGSFAKINNKKHKITKKGTTENQYRAEEKFLRLLVT